MRAPLFDYSWSAQHWGEEMPAFTIRHRLFFGVFS